MNLLLLLSVFASESHATCRRVIRQQVEKAAVVVEKVAAIAVPVATVAVPYYSGYYTPAPTEDFRRRDADLTQAVQELATLLRQMDARIQRLEQGVVKPTVPQPPAPQPMPPAHDPFNPPAQARIGLPTAFGTCVQCHRPGGEGYKSLPLFDAVGNVDTVVAERSACQILTSVYLGRMPKGAKVTDEQVQELVQWVDKVQRRAAR